MHVSRLQWFLPGVGIKRWFSLTFFGAISIGFSILLAVNAMISYDRVAAMGLGFLRGRSFVAGVVVGGAFMVGVVALYRGLRGVMAFERVPSSTIDEIRKRARLARGPRIVAVGGGSGLAALLSGLKHYSTNLTAIVTVADDGGSSGRLREDMGVLPPGDIRNCLVALADDESLLSRLFQYRFEGGGMDGHSFGNLFVAALADVLGDFELAVKESTSVLKVRGRVLPATLDDVILHAQMRSGDEISGESTITASEHLPLRIWLEPESPQPLPEALEAIEKADLVVLGPGSVYTSIIPNLLVEGFCDALKRTRARVVYVCNVMTQPGETDDYSAADHLHALYRHGAAGSVDDIVVNSRPVSEDLAVAYGREGSRPVAIDESGLDALGVRIVRAPVATEGSVVRHDSRRLAEVLLRLARR